MILIEENILKKVSSFLKSSSDFVRKESLELAASLLISQPIPPLSQLEAPVQVIASLMSKLDNKTACADMLATMI
jgi:hypothetical protein